MAWHFLLRNHESINSCWSSCNHNIKICERFLIHFASQGDISVTDKVTMKSDQLHLSHMVCNTHLKHQLYKAFMNVFTLIWTTSFTMPFNLLDCCYYHYYYGSFYDDLHPTMCIMHALSKEALHLWNMFTRLRNIYIAPKCFPLFDIRYHTLLPT